MALVRELNIPTPLQIHYFSENLIAPGIESGPLDLYQGTVITTPQRRSEGFIFEVLYVRVYNYGLFPYLQFAVNIIIRILTILILVYKQLLCRNLKEER
jgi:hypothetical protein